MSERAEQSRPRTSTRTLVLVGLAVCLLLAGVVSAYASSSPDGLERVAETLGFVDTATNHAAAGSPLADYQAAGVDDSRLSGGLAGVVGVAVTGALAFALVFLLRRRSTRRSR